MTKYYYSPDYMFKIRKVEKNVAYCYDPLGGKWFPTYILPKKVIPIPEHLALLWISCDN